MKKITRVQSAELSAVGVKPFIPPPSLRVHKGGARRIYTEEMAAEIFDRMAHGENLNQICKDDHMPSRATISRWVDGDPAVPKDFATRWAKANEAMLEHMAGELQAIADDGSNDWMEREVASGRIISMPDHEHINRSRLRVDTRKWLLSKLAHTKYGDKLDLNVGGQKGGAPLQSIITVTADPIEAAKIYQQMMADNVPQLEQQAPVAEQDPPPEDPLPEPGSDDDAT